ncbi:hypothetical protein [Streptomyces leeuwenhoekii]|nr:hypothetical protein [Streptomyces leeuwenhoekii]
MGEQRGPLRGLQTLMWIVIVIEVPVYLVWLVQVGYLTGQELPCGDIARWAPPVLLPLVAVLFCVMAGWTWWLSVVARTRSPLREKWVVASLAFVAVSSVLCGVASVDDPSVPAGPLSVIVTGLGMAGLFFTPAACSRQLPDVVRRRSSTARDEAAPAVAGQRLPDRPGGSGPAMLRIPLEEVSVSEPHDVPAAASLRKAVEQLSGDGTDDGSKAVQDAVKALFVSAGQAWTPEQETQIRALVEQIRMVRDLNRPGGGWWRRRREWRAREGLVDLMEAAGPELVNEAELRHWKSHATVELLLEFAGSAMTPYDTTKVLTRLKTLHAVTHKNFQQPKKVLADRKDAAG